MKCGAEDFALLSLYSSFYVVIKVLLFSFRISMNVDDGARLLSYVISNFIMKEIFAEQFFVLIDPA